MCLIILRASCQESDKNQVWLLVCMELVSVTVHILLAYSNTGKDVLANKTIIGIFSCVSLTLFWKEKWRSVFDTWVVQHDYIKAGSGQFSILSVKSNPGLIFFLLYFALWLVEETPFSTNQMQNFKLLKVFSFPLIGRCDYFGFTTLKKQKCTPL